MAEKLSSKKSEKPVTKAVAAAPTAKSNRRALIIGGSVAAGVLFVTVIAAIAFNVAQNNKKDNTSKGGYMESQVLFEHGFGGFGRGQTVRTEIEGDMVTTTVYKYLTGVVTEISNDSILVAGGGREVTIKTNGDTKYFGGDKPAVNDTVIVTGTTTDGTITATQIRVNN